MATNATGSLITVFCRECGYRWNTTTDDPTCPKCESDDIAESEHNHAGEDWDHRCIICTGGLDASVIETVDEEKKWLTKRKYTFPA